VSIFFRNASTPHPNEASTLSPAHYAPSSCPQTAATQNTVSEFSN